MTDPLHLTAADITAQQAKQMPEATLQTLILRVAHSLGWMAYHTHDSRRSQPGFPDLVLVRGRRVIWRELKTQTGRLRPDQTRWLNTLELAGQDTAVWRPADWYSHAIQDDLGARA